MSFPQRRESFLPKTFTSPMFKHSVFTIIILFILIALDQASKYTITNSFPNLVSYNTGIALSIPIPLPLTILFSITILLWLAFFFQRNYLHQNTLTKIALLLLISGGFSNLIDRILFGHVIDYLPFFNLFTYNIADIFITTGGVLFLFSLIIKRDFA